MPTLLTAQVLQHQFQAVFKLAAIGEPRQRIMGRLPGKVGDVLALLRHVVQHQHCTADLSGAMNRCPHQRDSYRTAVHALN